MLVNNLKEFYMIEKQVNALVEVLSYIFSHVKSSHEELITCQRYLQYMINDSYVYTIYEIMNESEIMSRGL